MSADGAPAAPALDLPARAFNAAPNGFVLVDSPGRIVAANAELHRMFGFGMSHEIRTPMNAIVGLSRLALEDDMPPRARDFIDKVHSSALAPMGILDDVLDYSKIEAGPLHLESIEFELDELLQRVSDGSKFSFTVGLGRALAQGPPIDRGEVAALHVGRVGPA